MRGVGRLHLFDVLIPGVVVTLWMGIVSAAGDLEQQRGLVFVGGPLVLLAGLHGRITDYLHARARMLELPLPLEPSAHWTEARPRHVRGLVLTAILGALGLVVLAPLLVPDWLLLCAAAFLVEPVIPAFSSDLGRRLPEGSRGAELQRGLGGGLTLPEATIHLWAPALGIGLSAAVAMPAQLAADRFLDGATLSPRMWGMAALPFVIALALWARAGGWYARGLWEAVPWLHETTRTLAGPPRPEDTPRWIELVPNPAAQLWLLQLGRRTPVPAVRLLMLLGWSLAMTLGKTPQQDVAVLVALVALWLLPVRRVLGDPAVRRFLAPLPVRGPGPWPAAVVLGPVVVALALPLLARGLP